MGWNKALLQDITPTVGVHPNELLIAIDAPGINRVQLTTTFLDAFRLGARRDSHPMRLLSKKTLMDTLTHARPKVTRSPSKLLCNGIGMNDRHKKQGCSQ